MLTDYIFSPIRTRRWKKEAQELVEKSMYASKIKPLLENPRLGRTTNSRDISGSNCFGSVFYLVGLNESRVSIEREYMADFLNHYCTQSKDKDTIVSFWTDHRILHAGIFLGQASGLDTLFHQPDTEEDYELQRVQRAYDSRHGKVKIMYHELLPSAKDFVLPSDALTPTFHFF